MFFLAFNFSFKAQETEKIKKLKQEVAIGKDDTAKVKKLLTLSFHYMRAEFAKAIDYTNQAFLLSVKLGYTKGIVNSYNNLGDTYWYHSDFDKAQRFYFKAYRINDSIHDKKAIATSLYNMGWIISLQQGNYRDNRYLFQSLKLFEELKDTSGLTRIYNAMSNYYKIKLLDSKLKTDYDSAIIYFNKGLEITKKRAKHYSATIYSNMGEFFYDQKDYKSGIYYTKRALEIYQNNGDSTRMLDCILHIAECDLEMGNAKNTIANLHMVYEYNLKHDIPVTQLAALDALSKAYYLTKDFQKSYDYGKKYIDLKEETDTDTYSTSISDMNSQYEMEKSAINIEKLKRKNELEELIHKRNKYFIFALIAVAIIVISFSALLFKQNKEKQLTNNLLKEQNHIIAEKKQEIDSSIQYAKGIQQAILPNLRELSHLFPQSFVYYTPKDVVSGDFYWFSKVYDGFYCVAADCTGHGVPGALMSIIGIEKLAQSVFEKRSSGPSAVLSFLNIQIKQVLKQHSDASKQKDGMDLALLKFNSSLTEVQYAGANRPLLIIRDKEVLEFKADKTAIAGFTPDDKEFVTTTIPLQKNDSLFIFTDGYADQFGGENGKKFMFKKLKDVLISVSELPAQQQKEKIEMAFNDWKGSREQVDDVLIIGITI